MESPAKLRCYKNESFSGDKLKVIATRIKTLTRFELMDAGQRYGYDSAILDELPRAGAPELMFKRGVICHQKSVFQKAQRTFYCLKAMHGSTLKILSKQLPISISADTIPASSTPSCFCAGRRIPMSQKEMYTFEDKGGRPISAP